MQSLKDEDLKKHYLRNVVFVRCVTGQIFVRKMAKDDHLNQIANIRKDQIKKIKDHGIQNTLNNFLDLINLKKLTV